MKHHIARGWIRRAGRVPRLYPQQAQNGPGRELPRIREKSCDSGQLKLTLTGIEQLVNGLVSQT